MPAALNEKFEKILSTIKLYPDQLQQSWEEVNALDIPDSYKDVDNIVFCGMGGSALGARMIDAYTSENRLRVPFEIFTEFHIPYYAGPKTLAVLSSYSGNTEETIYALHMALKQNTKVFGITAGGKMAEILTKEKVPCYIFDPRNNPSGQPRMSLGYATGAVLGLISKLGLAHITNDEVVKTVGSMRKIIKDLDEDIPLEKNEAKHFAKKLNGKMPVLVASEHLVGSAHALKNQLNESAKTFATLFDLPELNHHLMEGLARPAKAKELLHFVLFSSKLYPDRVQIRYPLTAEVVEQNDVAYSIYPLKSETKLEQVFELLTFGSLMVYYLSKSLQIDPMVIPWVDYFKKKLSS